MTAGPGQGLSPTKVTGLLQTRPLFLSPFPQVALHADQELQADQPPATETNINKIKDRNVLETQNILTEQ